MIYKPEQLTFDDQRFSAIFYGSPGVGKSTLAVSAPKPLLIDLDRGTQRIKAQHRVPTIRVNTYDELLEDLASEEVNEFETIVIDTGGALVTLLKDYVMRKDPVNRTKSGDISQKGFGAIKNEFKNLTDKLKYTYNKNIIYVFHSVEEKNKDGNPIQRLLCEGSTKNTVWTPVDLGAYMYKSGDKTYAGFTPTDEYFAKGCYGITGVREVPFGDNVKNDFLTRLFAEAKANIARDAEFFADEKARYDKVMEEGQKLIEEVITCDQAAEFTAKIKALPHVLTSLEELRALFKEHLVKIGISWNVRSKKYEYSDKPVEHDKQAEEAAETPSEGAKEEERTVSIDDIIAAEQRKTAAKRARKAQKESADEQ